MVGKPLAFDCPNWVCGGGSLSDLDPGKIAGDILNSIVKFFTGSPKDNLDWSIKAVTSTPVADLSTKGFLQTYEKLLALALIVGIVCVPLGFARAVLSSRDTDGSSMWLVLWAFIKLLAVGCVLPGIVSGALYITEKFDKTFYDQFKHSKPSGSTIKLPGFGNSLSDLFTSVFSVVDAVLLTALIVPISAGVYVFTVTSMIGYATSVANHGKISTLSRWNWAALATGVATKPMLTVILILGSDFISSFDGDRPQNLAILMLLTVALLSPFMLFRWGNKRIATVAQNRELRAKLDGGRMPKPSVEPVQQRRDMQRSMNAQLAAMSSTQPGSVSPRPKSRVVKDAALLGIGAGLGHIAAESSLKSASEGHHVRAAVKTYVHHRYIHPRTTGKVSGAKAPTFTKPSQGYSGKTVSAPPNRSSADRQVPRRKHRG